MKTKLLFKKISPFRGLGLFFPVLFSFHFANAQQFDWVTGGGTTMSDAYSQIHAEATYYETTDANGNIYTLSLAENGTVYADTFSAASYGADGNLVLSSYTCTGQMRWAKLIASTTGNCIPYGLVTDNLGHVYVAGFMENATLHIGYDTSLPGFGYEAAGLIQFDTSGHFNWIKDIGTNTIATLGGVGPMSLTLNPANNQIHLLAYMANGVPLLPGDTSHYGEYDLTYNSTGALLSAKRLGMDSVWDVVSAAIDPTSGKLFVCGQRNQGLVLLGCTYAAAFDTARNAIWMDTASNNATSINSILYDKIGHLYFGGGVVGSFSFNGDSTASGTNSVIMKTDTLGKPIWIHYFTTIGTNVGGIGPITLLPNNLVVGAGNFAGVLTDGVKTIQNSQGQDPFFAVLDSSGVAMSLLHIYGDGFYDWSTSITSDKAGNVYIGGRVEDSIYAANGADSIPAYHSVGGNSDFFVMKYGMDCGCTAMPVANFSVSGTDTAHTRNFTYTGTTTSIDSTVWSVYDTTVFAHGNTATRIFDTGSYEICVTVYTPCGQDMHCSRVSVLPPTGVGIVTAGDVQVYPNPATDELIITNATPGSKLTVLNIVGQQILTTTINNNRQAIDVSSLSNGTYLLEITKPDGSRYISKIIIEK